jgi:hypothetical protein
MFRLYLALAIVLAVALFAKFADYVPVLKGTGFESALKDAYEFLRDMSLLIATGGVAYVSNIYQKRANFIESLEEEWRGIVKTKSALYAFCEKTYATADDYIAAFCRISETLDGMRIVYRNVGETSTLVGLYPYAPLHDMRRALQTLDPRKNSAITGEHRKLVRDAILQSFYALRENFLEELDLEEPVHPLLISGGRRLKKPGFTRRADRRLRRQRARQHKTEHPRPDIDHLLYELHHAENPAEAAQARTKVPTKG